MNFEDRRDAGSRLAGLLLLAQGLYWTVTGVWPLVHMPSFLAVTGPKTDLWLVRTAGVLITAIGATLLTAFWRGTRSAEVIMLALLGAVGLAAIDIVYTVAGVISPIYLLDAAGEAVLILGWCVVLGMGLSGGTRGGKSRGHLAARAFMHP